MGFIKTSLIAFLFCSIAYAETIQTEFFTIHYALDNHEEIRFTDDIVAKLDLFAHHWVGHGVTLASQRLDIYVQPSDSVTAKDALKRLFGEQFFVDLQQLEQQLLNEISDDELVRPIQSFILKYPVFFKEKYHRNASKAFAERLIERLKTFIADDNARLRLYDDNARYIPCQAFDKTMKNAVVLGGSTNLNDAGHPYLTIDTVLHEIGHWFVHEIAVSLTGLEKPEVCPTFNEFMADVMAATFLDNPCRRKAVNGICSRDLTTHNKPLNEHLWDSSALDSHGRNQPIAHFFWDYYLQNGLELSSLKLVSAFRYAQREYPFYGREFTKKQLWYDYFLENSLGFRNDFEFAVRLTEHICQDMSPNDNGPCSRLHHYLGNAAEDFSSAESLFHNSPTVIGGTPKKVIFDGKKALLHFSNTHGEQGGIKAHLRVDDVESVYNFSYMTSGRGRLQLIFSSIDDTSKQISWDDRGILGQKNTVLVGLYREE